MARINWIKYKRERELKRILELCSSFSIDSIFSLTFFYSHFGHEWRKTHRRTRHRIYSIHQMRSNNNRFETNKRHFVLRNRISIFSVDIFKAPALSPPSPPPIQKPSTSETPIQCSIQFTVYLFKCYSTESKRWTNFFNKRDVQL